MSEKLQWYPGHMTRAVREMQEDMKLIDVFIEICDARIPKSSRNPQIDKLANGKQRVILLNKADLADEAATEAWVSRFREQGLFAAAIDARDKKSMRAVDNVVALASKKKRERDERRGIKNRPVRAMVGGIPNSGKSTFINSYAGRASAKTGNKPGVTKGKQWIRLKRGVELLDTPGILWPKFDDEQTGLHLAFVGSIKEEIYHPENLTLDLIRELLVSYGDVFEINYGITSDDPNEILEAVAVKRGCVMSGGKLDYTRASKLFLDDFRSGKLGRISIEQE